MSNEAGTNADTTKMRPEDVKKYGVEGSKRAPGHGPGEVLHQRRSLPYSLKTMTAAGFVITGVIGYLTLYSKKKPEASAADVAKAAVGVADPEQNRALRPK
ncbi:hypothetical protein H6P81_000383 [Aristolochia fimbriata]|uniref:Transmembrane protein n=1 Tax=Aristolochia fimbriata TaxID=158543 RepID=A0AAV7F6G6_ARIFI|nr:hypothetical protein H6P81_000383 [Aristolochia fimbriata]